MKRRATVRRDSVSLPFVLINMAMTADGKIATANRAVSSFGSVRDRAQLLALRATADAVMAGARTADANPVNLGPGPARYRRRRRRHGLAEFNLRVIVSGAGSVNPQAHVFQHTFSPIIVLTTRRAGARRIQRLRAAGAEVRICGAREINSRAALGWLGRRWGVRRLVCEGGGELNDALFRAGLVNELHLTVCPRIFGGRAGPTIADGRGVERLAQAARLELRSARRVGEEIFLVYRVRPAGLARRGGRPGAGGRMARPVSAGAALKSAPGR